MLSVVRAFTLNSVPFLLSLLMVYTLNRFFNDNAIYIAWVQGKADISQLNPDIWSKSGLRWFPLRQIFFVVLGVASKQLLMYVAKSMVVLGAMQSIGAMFYGSWQDVRSGRKLNKWHILALVLNTLASFAALKASHEANKQKLL